MREKEDVYLREHQACGLSVGDRVLVTRKAETSEGGWRNHWGSETMDKTVGQIFSINRDFGSLGFALDNRFQYPFFVLERVA